MKPFVLFLSVASMAWPQDLDWPKTLGVCDLLRDPLGFNGQLVAARGVSRSTDEGWWLAGENCSGVLQTNGYAWPTVLWLTSPTAIASMPPSLRESQRMSWGLANVDFREDERAFAEY